MKGCSFNRFLLCGFLCISLDHRISPMVCRRVADWVIGGVRRQEPSFCRSPQIHIDVEIVEFWAHGGNLPQCGTRVADHNITNAANAVTDLPPHALALCCALFAAISPEKMLADPNSFHDR